VVTGFTFHDRPDQGGMADSLRRFLDDGAPPIVFGFSSHAKTRTSRYYRESIAAAVRLTRRAVLVVGPDEAQEPAPPLPQGIMEVGYTPFSQLFPRAAVIVHHGGIGTVSQGLRSGRPLLIVPFRPPDQWDNAARAARLGVARTLKRKRYAARSIAAELQRLLEDPRYATRAAEVASRLQAENGAAVACDALEALLSERLPGPQPSSKV
jgi:UDP:flavonoid glycosyltransferase YjiC (YdhE family)